jgi:hypothetical protein
MSTPEARQKGPAGSCLPNRMRLAKHSHRSYRAASAKDCDEWNSPDGIAEQCRSDPHTHSHNHHDCGRDGSIKPAHGAP